MRKSDSQKDDESRFDLLMAKVPSGAKFVQIRTPIGKLKYRALTDVQPGDAIQLNKDGIPITMRQPPGRPKNVELKPINHVVSEILKLKNEAVENDPILKAAKSHPEDSDVLHQVVLALGEEAASIGFERLQAEQEGDRTSEISTRRIAALKAIAETWLKRKDQLSARGVDMNTPAFRVLLKFLMETFRDVMLASGVRGEMVETVFARLTRQMGDEWEAEAKTKMKNIA